MPQQRREQRDLMLVFGRLRQPIRHIGQIREAGAGLPGSAPGEARSAPIARRFREEGVAPPAFLSPQGRTVPGRPGFSRRMRHKARPAKASSSAATIAASVRTRVDTEIMPSSAGITGNA